MAKELSRQGVRMGVVRNNRTNIIAVEEDVDRISNLPDDITHRILSFIDMKYAVQTSTLSRKWKHVWTSMPYLNFNSRMFGNLAQFAEFVNHALSKRNNQTEVWEVELRFPGATNKPVVESIVRYAYLHNVSKLTMIYNSRTSHTVPRYLFSSHTLKHLTFKNESLTKGQYSYLPNFAWDLPVLETLNLSNTVIKSIDLFSKCANLKDLTLHQIRMGIESEIIVCCPQLSNLTITDVIGFPKVFKVIAPKLKNFTASATYGNSDKPFECLQPTEGFDSLEKVHLFLSTGDKRYKIGVDVLLSLFEKLRSAKFLILNSQIFEILRSNMNQLSQDPCPFNNLKSLKICTETQSEKDHISKIAIRVRKYLLENSPNATFTITDSNQHYASVGELQKRPWEQLYKEAKHTVAKLEEKVKMQDGVIAEQKSIHKKMMLHLINSKLRELQVQFEGGKPDPEIIRLMVSEIKSVIDLIPKSLRLNVPAKFFSQYESLKSLFHNQIDASHWEKIETELGSIRHPKRARLTKIPNQSNDPADMATSSRVT